MERGLEQACKAKKIPGDPHTIVEEYSCSDTKLCMMGSCERCSSHGLVEEDFQEDTSASDASGDSSSTSKNHQVLSVEKERRWLSCKDANGARYRRGLGTLAI